MNNTGITIGPNQANVIYICDKETSIEARGYYENQCFAVEVLYGNGVKKTRDKAWEQAKNMVYASLFQCNKVGKQLFMEVTGQIPDTPNFGKHELLARNDGMMTLPVVKVINFNSFL